MTCDILIRSYYKDFDWLDYSLRSIKRHCSGFSKVVLVVPQSSRARLHWLGLAGDTTWTCSDFRDDYLGQQVSKLSADLYTDADFVCHIDSDCMFHRETKPIDLFAQGKPRILMTPYERLDPHVPWKGITEQFLGIPVEFEFMRTPPYVFPRWIYSAFRNHAMSLHGVSFEDYILMQPPRGFSEFNALGAYAFYHQREHFYWTEVAPDITSDVCRVFWSWGRIDDATREEMERLLL